MVFSRRPERSATTPVGQASSSLDEAGERTLSNLLRSFQAGDRAAVARIEALIDRVVRFRGYYIPPGERVDIVQDVLLDVWQEVSDPGFVLRTNVESLVRTVACRACVDWIRRHRPAVDVDPALADGSDPPDREILRRERVRLGVRVLLELRPPCRELFKQFVVAGLGYREMADRQGRSEGALRTQMAQCLKEARVLLDRICRRPTGPWSAVRRNDPDDT